MSAAPAPSTSPTPPPAPRALKLPRRFNIFWAGQSASIFGDACALVAIPLLALEASGSVAQMGLVTAAATAGRLLSGLFAGVIADRADRRKLMFGVDIARGALYAAVPLTWLLAGPQMWLLYVVQAATGVFAALFDASYATAVPALVEDESQIEDANARLEISYGVGYVLGPAVAGLMAAQFSVAAAIGLDAVSFILSALSLVFIRFRRSAPAGSAPERLAAAGPAGNLWTAFWAEFSAGVRYLLHEPALRAVLVIMALYGLGSGVYDLYVFHLKHDLGQADWLVGVVFSVASLGSILGGVSAPALRRRFGFGVCFLASIALEGIVIAVVGLTDAIWLVGLMVIGGGATYTVRTVVVQSMRQRMVPDRMLGRIASNFNLVATALMPVGAAVSTLFAAQVGATAVLVGIGAGCVLLALGGWLTAARAANPETEALARQTAALESQRA